MFFHLFESMTTVFGAFMKADDEAYSICHLINCLISRGGTFCGLGFTSLKLVDLEELKQFLKNSIPQGPGSGTPG